MSARTWAQHPGKTNHVRGIGKVWTISPFNFEAKSFFERFIVKPLDISQCGNNIWHSANALWIKLPLIIYPTFHSSLGGLYSRRTPFFLYHKRLKLIVDRTDITFIVKTNIALDYKGASRIKREAPF